MNIKQSRFVYVAYKVFRQRRFSAASRHSL